MDTHGKSGGCGGNCPSPLSIARTSAGSSDQTCGFKKAEVK